MFLITGTFKYLTIKNYLSIRLEFRVVIEPLYLLLCHTISQSLDDEG